MYIFIHQTVQSQQRVDKFKKYRYRFDNKIWILMYWSIDCGIRRTPNLVVTAEWRWDMLFQYRCDSTGTDIFSTSLWQGEGGHIHGFASLLQQGMGDKHIVSNPPLQKGGQTHCTKFVMIRKGRKVQHRILTLYLHITAKLLINSNRSILCLFKWKHGVRGGVYRCDTL